MATATAPETAPAPAPETQQSLFSYQITRHLLSCNNIDFGKWYVPINHKDTEPSASLHGIMETLRFSANNVESFTSGKVLVSNLIRTWITAVLLYGSNLHLVKPEVKYLSLYISPF